jgi:prevent-host-death family protein
MVTCGTFVTMSRSKDRVVPAGEFKAKCLAIFDEVENKRRSFVVTKRGRPVARVVPLPSVKTGTLIGTLLHEEDLLAPVPARWEALL